MYRIFDLSFKIIYANILVALAGDFHGTVEGPLACLLEDILEGGCQAATIQQSVGSNLLAAQNTRGNQSLVPTTSIYT